MADEAQATGGLIDTAPREDYTLSEYKSAFANDPQKPVPTTPAPVQTFWDKLIHGVNGKSRTGEMLRSVGRGVVNAGSEALSTVSDVAHGLAGAAQVAIPGGTGGGIANAVGDATGAASEAITGAEEHYMGKRSDDPLAAFTESATQFMTGWAATGEISALSKLKGAAHAASIVGRGAVIDASLFNPREAQLAELAARAPLPVVKQLGDLLSVKGDDSQAVARLKRAAAGVVPAATIEGLVAAARVVRFGKAAAAGVPGAAEQMAEHAQTVDAVASGEHTPEGAHVTVDHATNTVSAPEPLINTLRRDYGDGAEAQLSHRYENLLPTAIKAKQGQYILGYKPEVANEVAAEFATSPNREKFVDALRKDWGETIPVYRAGEIVPGRYQSFTTDPEIARQFSDTGSGPVKQYSVPANAVAFPGLDRHSELVIDGANVTPGAVPEGATLKFSDPVEAAQQAESINAALTARQTAGQVDPVVVDKTVADVTAAVTDPTPATQAATADVNLGISHHTTPDDAVKIATDLSDKFSKAVRGAVESQGSVHVEQSMQMALEGLGDVPREMAHDVLTAGLGKLEGQSGWKLATDYVMKSYQDDIMRLGDVVTARPHDIVAGDELRAAIQNYFDLQEKFLAANSDAARALRLGQERPALKGEDVRFKGEGEPVKPSNADGTAPIPGDASPMRSQLENATPEQLAALGRIFKMSGGEPRNADAIKAAAKVVLNNKPIRQALELFTNWLLSGPKTAQTVLASGSMLNVVEPIVRMIGGAGSLNSAMLREGADQLAGAFKYAKENAIVAGQALREGRGILDPSPQTIAIDGTLGKAIRIPGNAAGAAHEFGKVTGYRAWVYARSLREGRAIGLSGDALAAYTDNNLRAAFSPDGIAIVPDALKHGQTVSLSTPYRPGSFGESLSKFTQNALITKYVIPFAKISTNVFNYTFDGTAGLNMLASRNRDIIRAGGEEAAMLHARSVAMAGIYYLSYSQAVQGNVTGRGPSDPQLRAMWLKDNQPYSVRANATSPWHSYQRFEPLAKTLGMAADYHTISSELGDKHVDAEHMLYAGGQAIINNITSATYMKNLAEFGAVWASENPAKLQNYLEHLGSSMVVPSGVSALNADPIYRDVHNMRDAIYARTPGFSQTLDPLFSWAGEPIMRTPGTWNRNLSISTTKDGTPTPVEQEMLAMKEKLEPFPQNLNGIDLTDRQRFDNGTGVSPYRAFMNLLDKPANGDDNLRTKITDLVKSPEWKDMGAGADGFPGGERMVRVRRIKERAERTALESLKEQYPKLANQLQAAAKMKEAAMTTGELGVQGVEKMFNTTRRP